MKQRDEETSLKKIQTFIKHTESLFFLNGNAHAIDYAKLDSDSPDYDSSYEKKIRRKEINLIYLLEELRLLYGMERSECLTTLFEIEARLFSPQFYRILIFKKEFFSVQRPILHLSNLLEKEASFINQCIPDSFYKQVRKRLKALNPPKSKGDFVHDLKKLSSQLRITFCFETEFLNEAKSWKS